MKSHKKIIIASLLLIVWVLIYMNLGIFSDWLVYDVFRMSAGARITEAVRFFIFDFPKVLLLLILISFVVGIIRSYFTPDKTRRALAGKRTFTGNVLASVLGIVTPFCSCSAIPMFIGFVESGVPLGITFSFLISSPMINEVAVVMLYGMFGWQVALIYILMGLIIAINSGWVIGRLKLEKWVEDWVYATQLGEGDNSEDKLTFDDRIKFGYDSMIGIVKKVWLFIAIGIAIGAGMHGYVPAEFLSSFMGKANWYAVPLATLIGIPLYSNAAGILPIVAVLVEKGAAIGTALSFMMATIALSLPEMIMLRKILKLPLILSFIGIVGVGIMIVGFLFNIII
ncbi:MAG TPA: permease [Bacteroidales bacterium]|nr:permease [Bacteroidales bacterium]